MPSGEMLEEEGSVSPRSAPRGRGISRRYERKWEYRARENGIEEQEGFRVLARPSNTSAVILEGLEEASLTGADDCALGFSYSP